MKYFFHIVLSLCIIIGGSEVFGADSAKFQLEILNPDGTSATPQFNTGGGGAAKKRKNLENNNPNVGVDPSDLPGDTTDTGENNDGDIVIITGGPEEGGENEEQEVTITNPYEEEVTITIEPRIYLVKDPNDDKDSNINPEIGDPDDGESDIDENIDNNGEEIDNEEEREIITGEPITITLPPNSSQEVTIPLLSAPEQGSEEYGQELDITGITNDGKEKEFNDVFYYIDTPIDISNTGIEKISESFKTYIPKNSSDIQIEIDYENTSTNAIPVHYEIYGKDGLLHAFIPHKRIKSEVFYILPDSKFELRNLMDTIGFLFPIDMTVQLIYTDKDGMEHILKQDTKTVWHLSEEVIFIISAIAAITAGWWIFGFWYWKPYIAPIDTTLSEIIKKGNYQKKKMLRKNKQKLHEIIKEDEKVKIPRWKKEPKF